MKRRASGLFGLFAVLSAPSCHGGGTEVPVAKGEMRERIVARAVVSPLDGVAEVRSRIDGRVVSVAVREGDRVIAGQLLAELEAGDLEAEVSRREAERRALEETTRSVTEGARNEERAALEAEVRARREDLSLAEAEVQRYRRLRASGGISESEMEMREHAVRVAKAALEASEARLNLARSGGRSSEVQAMKARVVAAEAAIAAAKTGLNRSRITSPISGVVLARRVDPGDTIHVINTPAPLFEIADVERTEIRAEIEELDAERARVGLEVMLTEPGKAEPVAHGRVARVSSRLERRGIGLEDSRVRAEAPVRPIWIEWTKAETAKAGAQVAQFPVGLRLEAHVLFGTRTVDALVPKKAVKVREGSAVVTVPTLLGRKEIRVRLGAVDEERAELIGFDGNVTRVLID